MGSGVGGAEKLGKSATRILPDVTSMGGGKRTAPPSVEEALKHRQQQLPRTADGRRWTWRELTIEKMGLEFGSGVGLYFATLRMLAVLALLVFLLYTPMLLVANASSNYVDIYRPVFESGGASGLVRAIFTKTRLSSLTLGGIAQNDDPGVLVYDADHINVYGQPANRQGMLIMVAVFDLAAVLLFLGGVVFMYLHTARTVLRIDHGCVEVADYTLLLARGLPEDAEEEEVLEFFERGGFAIREVVVVPKIQEVLGSFLQRSAKLRAVAELEARLDLDAGLTASKRHELEEQLAKVHEELEALERKITDGQRRGLDAQETMAAFVTFENEADMLRALALFPHHTGTWLAAKWSLHWKTRHRFRGRHALLVTQALPPADYVLENFSHSAWTRAWRKACGALAVCGLLAASLAVGVSLGVARQRADATASLDAPLLAARAEGVRAVAPTLAASLGLDAAQASQVASSSATLCAALLDVCSASLSGGILVVRVPFGGLLVVNDTRTAAPASVAFKSKVLEAMQDCGETHAGLGSIYSSSAIGQACSATGLNPCHTCYCAGLSQAGTEALDPATVSQQCSNYIQIPASSQALKIGVVITTVVVNILLGLLIVYMVKWEKYLTRTQEEWALTYKTASAQLLNTAVLPLIANAQIPSLSEVFGGKLFNRGYPDFTSEWYSAVGTTLMLTILINVFTTRALAAQDYILPALMRWWRRGSVFTQEALNELYNGRPFLLADKYTILIFYLGIAVIYSGALPVLLLFAAVAFLLQYVMDKHKLLRCCATPIRYSDDMQLGLLGMMPLLAIIHLAVTAWMLSYFKGTQASLEDYVLQAVGSLAAGQSTAAPPARDGTAGVNAIDWGAAYNSTGAWAMSDEYYNNKDDGRYSLRRLFQVDALILFIPLLLLTAAQVVQMVVRIFVSALGCLSCRQQGDEGLPPFSRAVADGRLQGTPTYRLQQNPALKDLFRRSHLSQDGSEGGIPAASPGGGAAAAQALPASKVLASMVSGLERKQTFRRAQPGQPHSGPSGISPGLRPGTGAAGAAGEIRPPSCSTPLAALRLQGGLALAGSAAAQLGASAVEGSCLV